MLIARRRSPWPLSGFLAALALVSLGSAPARADYVLDQQYDPTGQADLAAGVSGLPSTQKEAQTFTVGITGELDRVDVYIGRFPSTTDGFLNLEVRATTPTGEPAADPSFLALASVPVTSIPVVDSIGFVAFDVSAAHLQVASGDRLAAVLYSSNGSDIINWVGSATDPYAGGGFYNEQPPGVPWLPFPGGDLGFRDFVTARAVPEPASLAMLGTGFVGLLGYRIRRRAARGR